MAKDGQALIDFVTAVFGATPERRIDHDGPHRARRDADRRLGDHARRRARPVGSGADLGAHLRADVDATYQKALAAGGTSMQPPSQRDGDPDRRGGVADPWGNQWWISTQIS